ncbi:MAG: DUF2723 domain-containing protein [Desulfobacterota bacterium]|nr:DUF2723 domain-containing protein [Thermodesulfobacteriota bacterium]
MAFSLLPFLIFLAPFAVYSLTLAPGVGFVDSGELAAVCTTLGIAHPTGYPLYTLLGWLCTHLPLPLRPVVVLNLFSAVCSAAGAVAVYYGLAAVVPVVLERASALRICLCCAGSLLWAFCSVVWSCALITEVYALQGLLIALISALCLVMLSLPADAPKNNLPHLLALLLGLSFSNHLSTVLLVPAVIYVLLKSRPRKAWHHPLKLVCLFCAGFLPYLYLPIRARMAPPLNWGDPRSWEAFFWHVSGKQYRVWMFASLDTMARQAGHFFNLVLSSLGYLPAIFIPLGIYLLVQRHRSTFLFSLIVFAVDVLYAVNYDIKDIDPYFLPALLMCCLWTATGMAGCAAYLFRRFQNANLWLALCLCCMPLVPLMVNYRDVAMHNDTHAEQYTTALLSGLAPNALVLSYQWDYFCSPFYYLQLVEGKRPDVVMIEVLLLKRSWYLAQLERTYPTLIAAVADELAQYRNELYKFEHELPYDAAVIQSRYINLINSIIRAALRTRPVYLTCEIEPEIGAGWQRVPEGLAFRLYQHGTGYVPFESDLIPLPSPHDFKEKNRYHQAIKSFYAVMRAARALYELSAGNRGKAEQLMRQANSLAPEHPFVQHAKRIWQNVEKNSDHK